MALLSLFAASWIASASPGPMGGAPVQDVSSDHPFILVTYLNVFGDQAHGWPHWQWRGIGPDGEVRNFQPDRILGPEPWRRDLGVGRRGDYPLTGPYHAGSEEVVRFQFECMQRAGIEGVVLYLYDDPAFYSSEDTLRMILDQARDAGLAVCFCDSEAEVGVMERFGGVYSEAFYEDAVDRAARTLGKYAAHPAYLRVDGRPFWMIGLNMENDPERVKAYVSALREKAGGVYVSVVTNAVYYMYEFGRELVPGWPKTMGETLLTQDWADTGVDCFTCYSPLALAHADPVRAAQLWSLYVDDSRKWGKDAMVFVMAGYDDSNWRHTLEPIPRRGGEAWRERLKAGLSAKGARFLTIQCWNEWHEGALLEPNRGLRNEKGELDPFLNLQILAEELGHAWVPPRVPRGIVDGLLLEHGGALLEPYLGAGHLERE